MRLSKLPGPWPVCTGEEAGLIRSMDWVKTSLGPSCSWPQSLKTVLDLMLPAKAEMAAQALAGKEAALRKEQELTRLLLDSTSDQLRLTEAAGGIGSFLLEIKTNAIIASAGFCRLFGLPVSRTLPANTVEPLFDAQSADVVSTEASRRRGDALLNVEYRIRRADTGKIRWISRRAEFVRDDHGNPVWMRGVVQDVTERKLAEVTLQESESRFRVLAQAVPNQVWSATPEGSLDWLNQKVFDYSGLAEEKLLGDGWAQLVHPKDLQRVGAEWRHSLQCKTRYETEFRLRRHDGIYRWHLARAMPIESEGATRWLGSNTDIEEQKATQAELAQLNATLEQRVEQRTRDRMWRLSTDLILVAGFDGIIKSVNPAWQKLLGWEERELIGRPLTHLVHEEDRQSTAADVRGLSLGRTTQRFENRYRHKDGSYKTISWIAVPDSESIPGLGLSMIHGFAKQSGGHVGIHSHLGQGTEVSLYLPRYPDEVVQKTGKALPVSRLQGEGETLLVVEDDPAVRMIVLDELNELGYTTLEAMDGSTAIPILQSVQKIDLLISDVGLPGMNGRQIAEIGRQLRPGLPVLFMTGYAQSAVARSEFLAPGMEMIAKPFAMDELTTKIRDMLNSDELSRTAASLS